MLRALILTAAAAVVTLALTSCGTPGAPQPPSLQLPQPPDDLAATRKGNKVTLTWTMARETTDGASLKQPKLGLTKICRGVANPLAFCTDAQNVPAKAGRFVGQLESEKTPIPQQERGAPKLTFTDTLTPEAERGHEAEFANYAVQIFNSHGRAAGLSNQVRVPLAPVAPPPAVRAEVTADAVRITVSWMVDWPAPQPDTFAVVIRVQRRAEDSATWTPVAEEAGATASGPKENVPNSDVWLDRHFEWQQSYLYRATAITRVLKDGKVIAEVEGDDSPEVRVFTKDVFPPAQPSGVQAVFSGTGQKPFIDVTWAPNTEDDVAGYNVMRHEQGTPPEKINAQLVSTPSFRDENVQAGHTYFYSVTAVDLRKNESQPSEETSETVPK